MTSKARSRKKSSAWKWIALGAALLGLSAAVWALPIGEWLRAFNEWVGGLGAWGLVIFIVVYVIATVLLVPGSALTVGAGFAFGWGLLAVSLGSTTGAALAFLIARSWRVRKLRPWQGTTKTFAGSRPQSESRARSSFPAPP
jgi:uncharacterized membrane protein YdjX (TVP38/TMEM64 family)